MTPHTLRIGQARGLVRGEVRGNGKNKLDCGLSNSSINIVRLASLDLAISQQLHSLMSPFHAKHLRVQGQPPFNNRWRSLTIPLQSSNNRAKAGGVRILKLTHSLVIRRDPAFLNTIHRWHHAVNTDNVILGVFEIGSQLLL